MTGRRPLLVILNPRRIPECMDAFDALDVDKAYIRGMREADVMTTGFPDVLKRAPWADPISVVSDDTIVSQKALDTVLSLQAQHPDKCVTGWCPLAMGHLLCNLTTNRLAPGPPTVESYSFITCGQAKFPHYPYRTTFTGMALTTMSRSLWERFPFQAYDPQWGGNASDYHLSYRLQQADVEILTHRHAEIVHVKETWNEADRGQGRELLIGREPAHVVFNELREAA